MDVIAKGVMKSFSNKAVIDDFTYQFKSYNKYAIIGPNGSGKSTLIKILSGFIQPSYGLITYKINDKFIPKDEIYKHIAISTNEMQLIDDLTLNEHLNFHFNFKNIVTNTSLLDMLRCANLNNERNTMIKNFSSGMKQKLKLILAFLSQAKILFLDEPTSNFDNESMDWFKNHMINLKNKTLIMASNSILEYNLCDFVVDLQKIKKN